MSFPEKILNSGEVMVHSRSEVHAAQIKAICTSKTAESSSKSALNLNEQSCWALTKARSINLRD